MVDGKKCFAVTTPVSHVLLSCVQEPATVLLAKGSATFMFWLAMVIEACVG